MDEEIRENEQPLEQPEDKPANGGGEKGSRSFSQADIDRIVSERLARERNSITNEFIKSLGVEKLEDAQSLVKKAKDAQRAQMDELERASADLASAQKERDEALAAREESRQKLLLMTKKSAVKVAALAAKFHDPEDAWKHLDIDALEVDEESLSVSGVEDAIKKLAAKKPYLVDSAEERAPGSPNTRVGRRPSHTPATDERNQPTGLIHF